MRVLRIFVPMLFMLGVIMASAAHPRFAAAEAGHCWECTGPELLECTLVVGDHFGRDNGCGYFQVCWEGECSDNCAPNGAVCGGLDAVAMSGQVVESDPAKLDWDDEIGMYRRNCDGALAIDMPAQSPDRAPLPLPAIVID